MPQQACRPHFAIRSYRAFFPFLAILAVMGCSGGGSEPAAGYVGRVVADVEWKLPQNILDELVRERGADMARHGVTVAGDRLKIPPTGIPGLLVVAGSEQAITDANGVFTLAALPAGVSEGRIYKEREESAPSVAFPLNSLVRPGQSPNPISMRFVYAGPVGMDGPGALGPNRHGASSRANGVQHCVTDNSRACCEDQDGLFNDGNWYTDGYTLPRIRNFYGST